MYCFFLYFHILAFLFLRLGTCFKTPGRESEFCLSFAGHIIFEIPLQMENGNWIIMFSFFLSKFELLLFRYIEC